MHVDGIFALRNTALLITVATAVPYKEKISLFCTRTYEDTLALKMQILLQKLSIIFIQVLASKIFCLRSLQDFAVCSS